MAFGKIKADAIIRDNGGSEEEITMATIAGLDSSKAPLASPTFTGTVTLPATTALAGQASDVTMIDNNAAALEVKEGSTTYVAFDTTNSAEQVEVNVPLVLNSTTELRLADTDSSNHIAIKAPGTVASNVTLTLPADDGDDGQVLKTDGSGGLDWIDASGGLFESIAVVREQQSSSTDGGTFNSGDWRVRSINTEVFDPDNIVSVANNEITLVAGTYVAVWFAHAWHVNQHQTRLKLDSSTSTSFNALGSSSHSLTNASNQNASHGIHRFTLNQTESLSLQHRCQSSQSNGFGQANGWGNNIYSQVVFYKES